MIRALTDGRRPLFDHVGRQHEPVRLGADERVDAPLVVGVRDRVQVVAISEDGGGGGVTRSPAPAPCSLVSSVLDLVRLFIPRIQSFGIPVLTNRAAAERSDRRGRVPRNQAQVPAPRTPPTVSSASEDGGVCWRDFYEAVGNATRTKSPNQIFNVKKPTRRDRVRQARA
jgi:hypothetical protein